MDPPESIPNSEVKRCNADGSVGHPHVRVGHRRVQLRLELRLRRIEIKIKIRRVDKTSPEQSAWGIFYWVGTIKR